jgi:hypothetical protein
MVVFSSTRLYIDFPRFVRFAKNLQDLKLLFIVLQLLKVNQTIMKQSKADISKRKLFIIHNCIEASE